MKQLVTNCWFYYLDWDKQVSCLAFQILEYHNLVRSSCTRTTNLLNSSGSPISQYVGGTMSLEMAIPKVPWLNPISNDRFLKQVGGSPGRSVLSRKRVQQVERDNTRQSSIPVMSRCFSLTRRWKAEIITTQAMATIFQTIKNMYHVDERIQLFKYATMDAVRAGNIDGITNGELQEEMSKAEHDITEEEYQSVHGLLITLYKMNLLINRAIPPMFLDID
ncbi:hypothetical protein KEM48_009020 [Puccinia striiformis f. sp. tritici PST-130]|nr:hypothetical protein KEM48_009020 [Puccinia striiformis f. sp. tritici PST-130]